MKRAALTAAAVLAALLPARAAASEAAKEKRKELVEVQKQLEQRKQEIEEFRKEESALKRDVYRLATETSESKRKMKALESKIAEAGRKKEELKGRMGALQLAEGQWGGVLREEFRGFHRERLDDFDFFGRRQLWEEALRRAAILEKVDYLETLKGSRRKTEAAEAEAKRLTAQLRVKTNDARLQHETRESLYRQKQESYKETRNRVAQTQKTIRELEDSALALTRLVRTLERKSAYKASGGTVPIAEPKHSLPWPAEGTVVSFFGKQKVDELNTWMIHQGIRLATAKDAAVHPVKAGKVIFSGPFRSYGQVLIVDHGQAFYSIYGQLGRMLKKKGDSVRLPDELATAGSSGEGGTVYFEMRQSGDALDPMQWLKER